MRSDTVTLIVAALGICGTLGGIVVGHLLTRSWQQKQWMLDRRREEFRELLSVLVESFAKYGDPQYLFGPSSREAMIEQSQASARCYCVLTDRIFIAEDVKKMDLLKQWSDAIAELHQTKSPDKWGAAMQRMAAQIAERAAELP